MGRIIPVGCLASAVLAFAPPMLAAPPPCAGGRFLVGDQAPLVPGAVVPELEAVVLEGDVVSIASGCPPVAAKVRGGLRGTRIRARWPKGVCAGPAQAVRLAARIDPTCTTLSGRLRVKRTARRFTASLSACGDGILDRAGGETCPQLEGPGDAPAIEATLDLDAPTPIPDAARDADASGRLLVRTRIELVFAATATVAEVNTLVAGVGGRIVSMLAGVPGVVLDIPDPGSVAALEAVVAQLAGDPAVRFVLKAYEPTPNVLPDNYAAPLVDPSAARLDHHLAVRAAAAWNARAAMGTPPTVAVLDYFGDGAPDGAFDLSVPSTDFSTAGQGSDGTHGYHVLGIVSGRFGGPNTDRGQVTGIMPGTTVARVVDIRDQSTDFLMEQNRALSRLQSGGPRGILNTSLGIDCGASEIEVVVEAAWWAEKVRALGLEGRMLQTATAGNIDPLCPTATDADVNGPYAAAALLPLPVPNLANVLVVENVVNGPGPGFAPSCLSAGSKFPGHLAGIGTTVFSFTAAAAGTGNKSGTSMAAPQVAGLAAYLWSLAPTMSVQQLRQALLATASAPVSGGGPGCSPVASAPVIDAYAAVLSLDAPALPDAVSAPVRQAILDVDDSGQFDDPDLVAFVDAFIDPGTGDPREPTDRDFGRHDLNGDGFTGGTQKTARFDLDRIDSTQFGASGHEVVVQTMGAVDVPFDEAMATDLDVLCYYAYSALYEGGNPGRDATLPIERCVRARVAATFPGQVAPGVAEPLEVLVMARRPDGTDLMPLAGAQVELTPSGGTVGAPAGVTDEEGRFETTATASEGSVALGVAVVVRATPGGVVLAETSVDAAVDAGVDCTPNADALRIFVGATGVDTDAKFGDVGETLTDALDLPDRRANAQLSMGVAHVMAQMDEGAYPAVTGVSGHGTFSDPIVVTPTDPTLDGTGGRITARLEVVATGSASGDMASFWSVNLSGPAASAQRSGRFLATGYTGDPLGTQDLTFPMTFGRQLNVSIFSFAGAGSQNMPTSGGAAIDLSVRFLGYVDARDAAGNLVGFSVCTNVPDPSSTTSSTSSTTSTTVATTTTTSTTTLPGGTRESYRVYDATGPDGPQVTLIDRLRAETVDLGSVVFFLPPAELDGVPVSSQASAQTCYAHGGAPFAGSADVVHALGAQTLAIGDPVALCAPSVPSVVPVDHYACYGAAGDPLDQAHAVADEFQSQAVQVLAPFLLCLPVRVDDGALLDPFTTFTCYTTDPAGATVGPVEITNAFHAATTLDVAAPLGVCVPSLAMTSAAP